MTKTRVTIPVWPQVHEWYESAATLAAKLQAAEREVEALRGALAELVAVRKLKDDIADVRSDPYYLTYADKLEAEYERRKPAAWEAARAALANKPPATPEAGQNMPKEAT